jgi:hypothetical protein
MRSISLSDKTKSSLPVPFKGSLNNRYFLCAVNIFLTVFLIFSFIPNMWYHPVNNKYFANSIIRGVIILLIALTLVSGWSLVFYALLRKRKVHTNNVEVCHGIQSLNNPIVWSLQTCLVVSCELLFAIIFILRCGSDDCGNNKAVYDWSCNPYNRVPIFPVDTAMILMIIPVVFAVVTKGERWQLNLLIWFITVLAMIVSAVWMEAPRSLGIILPFLFISVVHMLDNRNVLDYLETVYSKLERSLEERQSLLDQQKLSQMKDVIGNVSHDLKTVSVMLLLLCCCLQFCLVC